MTIKVNGIDIEPSCIVDGDVHGQYTVDKLADFAIAVGLELQREDDPRFWRTRSDETSTDDPMADYYDEHFNDAGESVLELLSKNTQGGYFVWREGSVFLVADEDDDE